MAMRKGVGDARFAAVANDPRYARFPKKHHQVEIDDRFKGIVALVLL